MENKEEKQCKQNVTDGNLSDKRKEFFEQLIKIVPTIEEKKLIGGLLIEINEQDKEAVKKLKDDLHELSKTETLFHCSQCKQAVYDKIDSIFGAD